MSQTRKPSPDPTLLQYVQNAIFDRIVFDPSNELSMELRYPATNKEKNSIAYFFAGLTFFSPTKNRMRDQALVVSRGVENDKRTWVSNQTAVMDELRTKHAAKVG